MDKGFNDDELADIMNEIESLEQEFTDESAQPEVEASQEQTESVEEEVKTEEPQVEEVVAQAQEEAQSEVEEVVAEQEPEPVQEEVKPDPVVAGASEEMNEVLEELSEMPVEDVVPEKHAESVNDNIHHMKQEPVEEEKSWSAPVSSHSEPAHTSMSFKVEGEMKLDLNFCIGGQDVNLHVSDHGFEIELAGGAKFTLPLSSAHQGKKVA